MNSIKYLEVRTCKKCGCELVSDSKHNKCDNCRSKMANSIRRVVVSVGSAAVIVVKIVPKMFRKK